MRGPLLSGANSDESAADLDHGRIVDLHIAGHLRLRLGRPEGRPEEKCERKPERQRSLLHKTHLTAMPKSAGVQETIEHNPGFPLTRE